MRRLLSVIALCVGFAAPVWAAPTFVSACSGHTGTAGTLTISCSGGSGTNPVMVAFVSAASAPAQVTAAYNGDAMTEKYDSDLAPSFQHLAIYCLANPDAGTNNLIFTFGTNSPAIGAAVVYSGVDQTTPCDAADVVAANGSSTPSNDVTSASGDLVVDCVTGSNQVTSTAGANQTERVDYNNGDEVFSITVTEEAGAASVTMSETLSAAMNLIHGAVNLNAAAGAPAGPKTLMLLGIGPPE